MFNDSTELGGATVDGSEIRTGDDSDFTDKDAIVMSRNLMHTAQMLREFGGFAVGGNIAVKGSAQTNAADQDPDRP